MSESFLPAAFTSIEMHPSFAQTAKTYGNRVHGHSMRPGAHNTPAAEKGNDILSHVKGKYGELAFLRWTILEGLIPSHTPFRNDYTVKDMNDDFIVNGVQIEVKAKQRGISSPYPPPAHYNVNLGKATLEPCIYVFVEICPKRVLADAPPCLLVGWADAALISKKGRRLVPGQTSDEGNFIFKRHDWDMSLRDLKPVSSLVVLLAGSADRWTDGPPSL